MSYTPTEWKAGDTVTSAKLNKLEQGVASSDSSSGTLIVELDQTTMTLGEKAIDIFNALKDGKAIYLHSILTGKDLTIEQFYSFISAGSSNVGYVFNFNLGAESTAFYADTDNDYPQQNQSQVL